MQNEKVVIDKMVVDVFVDSHEAPHVFLNRTKAEIMDQVLPLIERKLEEMDLSQYAETVSIDRLEVDLEGEPNGNWQESLARAVTREISEGLEANLIDQAPSLPEAESPLTEPAPDPSRPDPLDEWIIQMQSPGLTSDAELEEFEALWTELHYYYLTNGALPLTLDFTSGPGTFLQKLRRKISELTQQDPDFPRKLGNWAMDQADAHFEVPPPLLDFYRYTHMTASVHVFLRVLQRILYVREVLEPLLDAYLGQEANEKRELKAWIWHFSKSLPVDRKPPLRKALEKFRRQIPSRVKIEWMESALGQWVKALQPTETKVEKRPQERDWLRVENGGMVLLNPFLPQLFRNLNLLNKAHHWRSEIEQSTAAMVVHYLATGGFDAEEGSLLLGKILTGIPFEESVLPIWEAQDLAKKLSIQLESELEPILEAIHENWRPMRNSSWPGLRADFLTRAGELEIPDETRFNLTVEPHGFDVMLPLKKWGMSLIKYSWMEQILYVDWEK